MIYGALSIGTGFILVQLLDEKSPEKGCNNIPSGSTLLPEGRNFSLIESEATALDRASCHHWIYYGQEVELDSDCKGLLGML